MVRSCCVNGCTNKSHDGKGRKINNGARFFKFPTWKKSQGLQVEELTKRRRIAWVSAVRRKNITFTKISSFMYVCSRHFHKGHPAYEMMETDPDWAPSLHLGHADIKQTDTELTATQREQEKFRKNSLQHADMRSKAGAIDYCVMAMTQEVVERDNFINVKANKVGESEQLVKEETQETGFCDHFIKEEPQETGVFDYHIKEEIRSIGESDHLIKLETQKTGVCDELITQAGESEQAETEEGTPTQCNMCVLRLAEIKRLLEANRKLQHELDQCRISNDFVDTDEKIK